ncbi:mycofactocin system glycosyltransferase [compost metagenome]
MKPSVAIVILNWNGKKLLEQFLPGVISGAYENLQVVLGDNASTDDSVAFVKAHYPQVNIICNEKNYGFSGGYNHVLSKVMADYFILLNSDVEVQADWIEPVIALMESDPQIAVAQPKIKWQRQKDRFEYAGAAGGFIDHYGFPFCRGRIFDEVEKDEQQYNTNMDVFWASGAAFFIKRKAWEEAGGFDADLFAHMEEIDLCWRLKNKGYRIVCCTDAEVYHVGGGTLNADNPYKTYLNFRNNLIILQKNLPAGEAFMRILIRFWFDFAAWIQFLAKGKLRFSLAISKAHFHFLSHLKRNAKKRPAVTLPFHSHSGIYRHSIVFQYFIRKIKTFNRLPL